MPVLMASVGAPWNAKRVRRLAGGIEVARARLFQAFVGAGHTAFIAPRAMQKALASRQCIMHRGAMRTHAQIIAKAGAPRIVEIVAGQSIHTVRSWRQRDSIPSEYWRALADAEIASLDELATAAALRRADQSAAA